MYLGRQTGHGRVLRQTNRSWPCTQADKQVMAVYLGRQTGHGHVLRQTGHGCVLRQTNRSWPCTQADKQVMAVYLGRQTSHGSVPIFIQIYGGIARKTVKKFLLSHITVTSFPSTSHFSNTAEMFCD